MWYLDSNWKLKKKKKTFNSNRQIHSFWTWFLPLSVPFNKLWQKSTVTCCMEVSLHLQSLRTSSILCRKSSCCECLVSLFVKWFFCPTSSNCDIRRKLSRKYKADALCFPSGSFFEHTHYHLLPISWLLLFKFLALLSWELQHSRLHLLFSPCKVLQASPGWFHLTCLSTWWVGISCGHTARELHACMSSQSLLQILLSYCSCHRSSTIKIYEENVNCSF